MSDALKLKKLDRKDELAKLARLVRYYILTMTTRAGSGHPTSSLSAADLMVALYFDKLRFDLKNPQNLNNDRVIFSKGHASPLFYALYRVAGVISDRELMGYRKFGSKLEGHPRPIFPYAEAATGSLGQGLSIGLGMALAMRQEIRNPKSEIRNPPSVYVLLGDSEMAEGSVWEAMEVASFYKVDNLVAVVDVNRLGQRGPTMLGWDIEKYRNRAEAFGWEVHNVDGHDIDEITRTFDNLPFGSGRPQMILAKTIKGKGVPFLEDKEGWHGKALSSEELKEALFALGEVDRNVKIEIEKPNVRGPVSGFPPTPSINSGQAVLRVYPERSRRAVGNPSTAATPRMSLDYKLGDMVATRKAFGQALSILGSFNGVIVSLDGEVKNSTFAQDFEERHKERFFEMFIAEQNMVGVAVGMAKLGFTPFVSTFSAFLTRASDQIRMASYSDANVKFVGSHSGVSIGEDGPSQMGLEEVSMFRTILGSRVFVPADAVSCAKIVEIAAREEGIFYIGTARGATPVIYKNEERFEIGGSKILRKSDKDRVTVVTCGVCVHEAIAAADELMLKGIRIRVIDAYSIKPIDKKQIMASAHDTNGLVITVEDHYHEGGLGDAVLNVFGERAEPVRVFKLAVSKMPVAGSGSELLKYEGIDSRAIVLKVLEIIG